MKLTDSRMNLHVYIATQALHGMLAARSLDWDIGDDKKFTAYQAFQYADAMLKVYDEYYEVETNE